MCLRVELIRGWLSHDLVAPSSLRHLTPIFISQAIKRTNTQTHTLQVEWFSCHSRDHLQARLTSTISHIFLHVILDTHTHCSHIFAFWVSKYVCPIRLILLSMQKTNPCDYFKQLCSSDAIFRQLTCRIFVAGANAVNMDAGSNWWLFKSKQQPLGLKNKRESSSSVHLRLVPRHNPWRLL